MAKFKRAQFQRPIPGQSLTTEPGSRPWEKPPKFTDPDEVMDYFMDKLTQPKNANRVYSLLESGVEVEAISSPMVMAGFVEGMYSPDVALLVAGPLAGFVKIMGEDAGIKTNTKSDNPAADLSIAKLLNGEDTAETEPVVMMELEGGLMGLPVIDEDEGMEDMDDVAFNQ